MKKYQVESATSYNEIFDNLVGDFIEAESPEEAVEFYKDWMAENGEEPENFAYRVFEMIKNECGEEEKVEVEY